MVVLAAGVDGVADDGRGAFKGVLGGELPADFQVVRQLRGGDAGLQRVAAEQGPVGGGGINHREHRDAAEGHKEL